MAAALVHFFLVKQIRNRSTCCFCAGVCESKGLFASCATESVIFKIDKDRTRRDIRLLRVKQSDRAVYRTSRKILLIWAYLFEGMIFRYQIFLALTQKIFY